MTENTNLSKSDVPLLLQYLASMGDGGVAEAAQDVNTLRQFYPLPEHARALDPHILLVIGDRGAGKTNLFRAIQYPAGIKAITELASGRSIPQTSQSDWIVGYDDVGTEHPAGMAFQSFSAGKEISALQHTWLGLLIKRLLKENVLKPTDLPGQVQNLLNLQNNNLEAIEQYTRNHLSDLFDVLDALDKSLSSRDRWVFVTYDALDRVSASNWEVMRSIIRGLVQFWASNSRRWTRLKPKIFLRRDLFDRVAISGTDVSKIAAQRVELIWTPTHLYRMILKRMMNSEDLVRSYLKDLELSGEENTDLGWCPGKIDEDHLKEFVKKLCGEFMGAGPNKGRAYTWIPNHLQDGNGHILPRSFLRLFENAAQTELDHPKAEWPHLIHHTSLRAAVDEVSVNRVMEITEEIPWITKVQEYIKQRKDHVPIERRKIESYLGTIEWGEKDRPPETAGRDLLNLLIELGVFYPKGDPKTETRVDVRDIYLQGFGFKRKGGVARA